jgi:hypothetical protein
MNKLTIQINNLEALERLIGGDTEVEVEVRNCVVQKFAEKHLKPLTNAPEVKKAIGSIVDHIREQITEKVSADIATFKTGWTGYINEIKLKPEIKSEIDSQVKNIVDDRIRNTVDEAIKTWANETDVNARIERRFEYYTNEFINNEIKARLNKLKLSL